MAMRLQEAIDFASVPANSQPYGLDTYATISMHDDSDTVLVGSATTLAGGAGPTFRSDLPLLNWGPATIGFGGVVSSWFNRPVPGFSTRGLGGFDLSVGLDPSGTAPPSFPIDLSVRRDQGRPGLSFLGLGPSVQIEIEKLSALGGTATGGVTLKAVEDGALLRAVGPSIRDPAKNASYTVTISVWSTIG